jgi:Cdc6-like AAA superfamily ATPase
MSAQNCEVLKLMSDLNEEQQFVFSHLMRLLEPEVEGETKNNRLVMLHGEAGTGKTFLYKKLSDVCAKLVRIFQLVKLYIVFRSLVLSFVHPLV